MFTSNGLFKDTGISSTLCLPDGHSGNELKLFSKLIKSQNYQYCAYSSYYQIYNILHKLDVVICKSNLQRRSNGGKGGG